MSNDTNIVVLLSAGPNVNDQQNLTGFVECYLALSGGSRMKC